MITQPAGAMTQRTRLKETDPEQECQRLKLKIQVVILGSRRPATENQP